MAASFFGQYLLRKQIITPEQLARAVQLQRGQNRSFGELALAEGLLTQNQITQLNHRQREQDLLLGELAVKLGWADAADVNRLLLWQRRHSVSLGAVLIGQGVLHEFELESLLADYHYVRQRRHEFCQTHLRRHPSAVELEVFADCLIKHFRRFCELRVLLDDVHLLRRLDQPVQWALRMPAGQAPDEAGQRLVAWALPEPMVVQLRDVLSRPGLEPDTLAPRELAGAVARSACRRLSVAGAELLEPAGGDALEGWPERDCATLHFSVEGAPLQVYFAF